ncbi:MAG: N4-gp56 family major capsid protein [Bdellovibrionota bacterium]
MATTRFTTNSNETVKLWAKRTIEEALRQSVVGLLKGKDEDAFIQIVTEANKDKGDRVRNTLVAQFTGEGKQGSETLKGDEESLTTYTQDLVLDQQRHAFKFEQGISAQRVSFDQKEVGRRRLSDWWADRISQAALLQLAGYTGTDITGTKRTGNNTASAPDANHIIRGGAAANDESCNDSNEAPTLALIDQCVAKAEAFSLADGNGAPIRPGNFMGEMAYAFICHPYFWYEMKRQTGTGEFVDLTKAFYQGSKAENPLVKGSLKGKTRVVGYYNGVYILTDPRCPKGVHSSTGAPVSNTRRGVFLGAQSAWMGFGVGFDDEKMRWNEEEDDYGNLLGLAATSVWGLIKSRYNAIDFGSIVVTAYTSLG